MKKPTLIMIHGFRGTHHGLLPIAKYFRKDFNVIIPDLPGFANGESLAKYDLENYTKWLHDFIKKQPEKQKPILLGHSFGSIIASSYAAEHPRSIEKLILVNPIGAPALEGPKKVLTKLATFYYRVGEKLPEKASRRWLGSRAFVMVMSVTMAKTKDKKLRAFIHDQHKQHFSRFHTAKSVSEGFKTSVSHNVADFANKISTPTLLIAGSLDDITSLSDQYALVKKFKKGTLSVIDHVGHLTHYETPDKVARIIRNWLERENRQPKKKPSARRVLGR